MIFNQASDNFSDSFQTFSKFLGKVPQSLNSWEKFRDDIQKNIDNHDKDISDKTLIGQYSF